MRSRTRTLVALGAVALVAAAWTANAQMRGGKERTLREMTVTGRIVDLHCFITGQMPSADPVRCTTDCLRAGVPAGSETEDGFFLLGKGPAGPVATVLPFAYQEVEIRGKLFEHAGIRYLDLASIQRLEVEEEESDWDHEEEDEE